MRCFAALLVLLAACASGQPDRTVAEFYRVARHLDGAPTPVQLDSIAPYLSDSLRARLVAARALHDREQLEHPSWEASFSKGNLFTSHFEGADSVIIKGELSDSVHRSVAVQLWHTDAAGVLTVWEDTVILVRGGADWRIDDIRYGGNWPLSAVGTLRERLQ